MSSRIFNCLNDISELPDMELTDLFPASLKDSNIDDGEVDEVDTSITSFLRTYGNIISSEDDTMTDEEIKEVDDEMDGLLSDPVDSNEPSFADRIIGGFKDAVSSLVGDKDEHTE